MSGTLFENGILFSDSKHSPAPYQDYHQLLVLKNEVIFRTWKVTPRKIKAAPSETKISFPDFYYSSETKNDIRRVFGSNILAYVSNLVKGQIDYLPRMPEKVLSKIISYLDLTDYVNVSQTSNLFHKLCKSDKQWERLFYKHHKMTPCHELSELAVKTSWKQLTFCNILQLRVLMLKHLKTKGFNEASGDPISEALQVRNNYSVTSLRRTVAQDRFDQLKSKSEKIFPKNMEVTNSSRVDFVSPSKTISKTSTSSKSISKTSSVANKLDSSSMNLKTRGSLEKKKKKKVEMKLSESQEELIADTDRVMMLSAKGRLDRRQEKKKTEAKGVVDKRLSSEDYINSP